MTSRAYDLREDARSLVVGQWLREGERLRTFAPTGRGNYRSEIGGYPSIAWRCATAAGWAALKIVSPVGILTGGVPYWNEIRRFEGRPPGLVAFGDGKECHAARLLGTGPRRSGIWVLSHERFGFAADRVEPAGGTSDPRALRRRELRIVLEPIIDVASSRFEYEGTVTRGAAVYLRIRFHDGSGVDVHNR